METVEELIEALGGMHVVAQALGVTVPAVWHWQAVGAIPPRWYHRFAEWGERKHINVPVGLFREKSRSERDDYRMREGAV